MPALFDADGNAYAAPWVDPWGWLQTLLIPWLVAAAPIAGYTPARDPLDAHGGARHRPRPHGAREGPADRSRHAPPRGAADVSASTAGLVWGLAPLIITNLVLVEWVFSVPGFFFNTKRALGKADPPVIDVPMLQAQAIWGAILIVMLGVLADLVVIRLDPRVRSRGF